MAEIGIEVAPVTESAKKRLDDRRIYSEVTDLIDRSGENKWTLTAWDLCKPMTDEQGNPSVPRDNPGDYREALEVLADCGMDVSEALAFADFCVARYGG